MRGGSVPDAPPVVGGASHSIQQQHQQQQQQRRVPNNLAPQFMHAGSGLGARARASQSSSSSSSATAPLLLRASPSDGGAYSSSSSSSSGSGSGSHDAPCSTGSPSSMPLQAQLASLGLLLPSASLAGDRNPYLGGKQLDLIRTLFFRVAALERSAAASPHRAPLLFLADSRRSKQPLEPKAFPFAGERTIVFKAMHLFAICPRTNTYTLHAAITPAVPWARLVRHEAACVDRENDVHLLHISIEYDYKLAPPEQRNAVSLRCGFVRFCEPTSAAPSAASSPASYRVGAMVQELAAIEFSMAPIAPNCTHQPNKVPRNHFLCRSPELLQFPLPDGPGPAVAPLPASSAAHLRYDIRQTIGLTFEPRSYCSTSTSSPVPTHTTSSSSVPAAVVSPSLLPATASRATVSLGDLPPAEYCMQQQQQPHHYQPSHHQPSHHQQSHQQQQQHHHYNPRQQHSNLMAVQQHQRQQPSSPHSSTGYASAHPSSSSSAAAAAALTRRHSVGMMTPALLASLPPFDLLNEQHSPVEYSSMPSLSSMAIATSRRSKRSRSPQSEDDDDDDDEFEHGSRGSSWASGSSTDSGSDDGTPLSLSPSSSCSSSSNSSLSSTTSSARIKSAKRRVLTYHPYRPQASPPRSASASSSSITAPSQRTSSFTTEIARPPVPNPKSSIASLLNQPAPPRCSLAVSPPSTEPPLMSEWDAGALLLSLTAER